MKREDIILKRHSYNPDKWKLAKVELPEKMEKDPILTTIFACNPVTGKPSSDLGLVFSSSTSLEVQNYIRQQLAVAVKSVSLSENADDALATVKSQFETIDAYVERIRKFVNDINNPVTE